MPGGREGRRTASASCGGWMAAGANLRPPPAGQASEKPGTVTVAGKSGSPSWYIECHTQASWPQEGEMRIAVMRYMVVIERGETSWGAHVPDLAGCVAEGEAREEGVQCIRGDNEVSIDGAREG